jgi:hypothetical protein
MSTLDTATSPINAPRYLDPHRWVGKDEVDRDGWWKKCCVRELSAAIDME